MNDKPIIKLGAVKGKLIPVLQEYLKELGFSPIDNLKKLVSRSNTFKMGRYKKILSRI